jgi:hypothetical protein
MLIPIPCSSSCADPPWPHVAASQRDVTYPPERWDERPSHDSGDPARHWPATAECHLQAASCTGHLPARAATSRRSAFTDQDGFRFPPTRPTPIWRHWRHATAPTLGSRTASAVARRPGCANLPFRDFAANEVWFEVVLVARDLVAWMQRLCLRGAPARWEQKRLRHRLLHMAARFTHGGRRRRLRLQRSWPWAHILCSAFERLRACPLPDAASSGSPAHLFGGPSRVSITPLITACVPSSDQMTAYRAATAPRRRRQRPRPAFRRSSPARGRAY